MARGKAKIRIADISREVGLSEATVSYVLSGSKHADRITEETKHRIIAAASRMGYNRNATAAALRRGYSDNLIVLAVGWTLVSGYAATSALIGEVAREKGLTTVLEVANGTAEATSFIQTLPSVSPYGLVLLWDSFEFPAEDLQVLRSHGLPIVDLMPNGAEGIASVTADRECSFFLLTKHLLDLGHTRIGILLDTTTRGRTSNRKLAGYKRALESAGLEFDAGLIQEVGDIEPQSGYDDLRNSDANRSNTTAYWLQFGYDGLRSLLARRPDVTGVICLNDPVAYGALAAAYDMGLAVPGDISIAGYGAHPESLFIRPRLTTAAVPSEEMAKQAVDTIVSIRTGEQYELHSLLPSMTLIVNESTGVPRHAGSIQPG